MRPARLLPSRLATWAHAIATVRRDFREAQGRPPRLLRPHAFSDKMQWRKLFQPDPRFAIFCDKLATRDYVAARAGEGVLVPLLWQGAAPEEIPFDRLDPPYVLKPSHSCGRFAMVRAGEAPDFALLRAMASEWLSYCHGTARIEPGYIGVPRRLMAERMLLAPDGGPPREYKLLVFDGRVGLVQVIDRLPGGMRTLIDRLPGGMGQAIDRPPGAMGVAYHDRDWARVAIRFNTPPTDLALPDAGRRADIVALAERLAAGLDHLRVDLYETAAGLHVGELTCYSWSGLGRATPPEADARLGALWRIEAPARRALAAVAFRRWDGVRNAVT